MKSVEFARQKQINPAAGAAWILCAAVLVLQFAPLLRASGGRHFAGFYDLTNVTSLGDEVRLTFAARIFNYSDSDVVSATVTLKGPGEPGGAYATFYGITFRDKESVRVSQTITVPQQQYEQWRKGQSPLLGIEFQDLSGAAQSTLVELGNQSVGE